MRATTFDVTVDFDSPPVTREQAESAIAGYYRQFDIDARVGRFEREQQRRERRALRKVRRSLKYAL